MAIAGTAAFWGGVIIGAVKGAIIGAAIGALTAAITGGDIGKGALFGAVGGAVVGGLTGAYAGFTTSSTTTFVGSDIAPAAGDLAEAANQSWESMATESTGFTAQGTSGATGGWLDNLTTSIGDGFKDFFSFGGEGAGGEGGLSFGQQAAMKGIEGAGSMYMKKKEQEAAEKAQRQALEDQLVMLDAQTEAQKELIAAQAEAGGGGGGGSAGGLSFEEQLALKDKDIQGALARTNAEIQGQKDLKDQEFARADTIRELTAASAKGIKTGGRTAGSRSGESLVALQDRIRQGENPAGDVNVAYDVPVDYVPA